MSDLLETIDIETGREPRAAVIWLHGLGADGHDFEPIVPELGMPAAAPPVRFVFPHAPLQPVTINGGAVMRAWYDVTGDGRQDAAGVRSSQARVEALIARERARGVAARAIVLAGFSQGGTLEETTEADFDELVAVNVKAPFFIIKEALSRLRDGGRIINISSGTSLIAYPEELAYAMTKGAVNTLTRALAKQLGPRGITVNAVAPGIIDTEFHGGWLEDPGARAFAATVAALGRVGKPEDVADVVAFLASEEARWVTGTLLDASGGSLLG